MPAQERVCFYHIVYLSGSGHSRQKPSFMVYLLSANTEGKSSHLPLLRLHTPGVSPKLNMFAFSFRQGYKHSYYCQLNLLPNIAPLYLNRLDCSPEPQSLRALFLQRVFQRSRFYSADILRLRSGEARRLHPT